MELTKQAKHNLDLTILRPKPKGDTAKSLLSMPEQDLNKLELSKKRTEKLMQLRKLNQMFGSNDPLEFLEGVEEIIGDALMKLYKAKSQGTDSLTDYRQLIRIIHDHYDRKFNRINSITNVFNQQNIVHKMTLKELHEQVILKIEQKKDALEKATQIADNKNKESV